MVSKRAGSKIFVAVDRPLVRLVDISPMVNPAGSMCVVCDGTHAHDHRVQKCEFCKQEGLAENMSGPVSQHACRP